MTAVMRSAAGVGGVAATPVVIAAAIAAAAAVTVAAAENQQQDDNDDPAAVAAKDAVVIAHMSTSNEIVGWQSSLNPSYAGGADRCQDAGVKFNAAVAAA